MIRMFRAGENIQKGALVYALNGRVYKSKKNEKIVLLCALLGNREAYVRDEKYMWRVKCFKNSGLTCHDEGDYVKLINNKKIVRLR